MANLNEIVQYEPGIYQLETTDPVLGGADGIDNLQAKQLANRTAYLKQHVDALESGATVPPGIATQNYVVDALNQRDNKQSVRAATVGNIALNAVQAIDGVNVQVADRVLVKNQNDATQNGIYTVTAGGWTRAADANQNSYVTAGLEVMVAEGTLQAGTIWKLTTKDPINLGASLLSFADITTGYAPLNSPAFTGDPTVPTAAQFDSDNSAASTAFVQRALGNLQGVPAVFTANTNLTAANAGQLLVLGGAAGAIGLPVGATLPKGAAFTFMSGASGGWNIVRQGADVIAVNGSTLTTLPMLTGDTITLVWDGQYFRPASGSAHLKYVAGFAGSLAGSGYQKLPSGLILQWGASQAGGNGSVWNTAFPIAFPTTVPFVTAIHIGGDGTVNVVIDGALSTTQFGARTNYAGNVQIMFMAIGY